MSFWRPTDEERLARIRRSYAHRYFWRGLFFVLPGVFIVLSVWFGRVTAQRSEAMSGSGWNGNVDRASDSDPMENARAEIDRLAAQTGFGSVLFAGVIFGTLALVVTVGFVLCITKLLGGYDIDTQLSLVQRDATMNSQPDGTE